MSALQTQVPILEQPWEFPHTHMFEIVPEMIVEHVNLLEQIKLEIRLHYEFKYVLTAVEFHHYDSNADDWPGTDHLNSKDLEAFEGIVKDLDKLNEKNIKEHEEAVKEAHLNNPKLKRKKFSLCNKKKQRRQQETLDREIKAASDRFVCLITCRRLIRIQEKFISIFFEWD
jgi:hypothetical protein